MTVAVDGPDGSGGSALTDRVAAACQSRGWGFAPYCEQEDPGAVADIVIVIDTTDAIRPAPFRWP